MGDKESSFIQYPKLITGYVDSELEPCRPILEGEWVKISYEGVLPPQIVFDGITGTIFSKSILTSYPLTTIKVIGEDIHGETHLVTFDIEIKTCNKQRLSVIVTTNTTPKYMYWSVFEGEVEEIRQGVNEGSMQTSAILIHEQKGHDSIMSTAQIHLCVDNYKIYSMVGYNTEMDRWELPASWNVFISVDTGYSKSYIHRLAYGTVPPPDLAVSSRSMTNDNGVDDSFNARNEMNGKIPYSMGVYGPRSSVVTFGVFNYMSNQALNGVDTNGDGPMNEPMNEPSTTSDDQNHLIRVLKTDSTPPPTWNTAGFDDSTWNEIRIKDLGTFERTTVYVRKILIVSSFEHPSTIDLALTGFGGIIGYLNGVRICRRFLPKDNVTATTYSNSGYDTFNINAHIIMRIQNVILGTNILAFEIHVPSSEFLMRTVQFDLLVSGNHGGKSLMDRTPETCDALLTNHVSSLVDGGIALYLFDRNLQYSLERYSFSFNTNASIAFEALNEEGIVFNAFRLFTYASNNKKVSFRLLGRYDETTEYVELVKRKYQLLMDRKPLHVDCPAGLLKFRQFLLVILNTNHFDNFGISLISLMYCSKSIDFCPEKDGYPSVSVGSVSPGACFENMDGFSYRICDSQLSLGDVQYDKCFDRPPVDITYPKVNYTIYLGIEYGKGEIQAKATGNIRRYVIEPPLETGLEMENITGLIFGKINHEYEREYLVKGYNDAGSVGTKIRLEGVRGFCESTSMYAKTELLNQASYSCSGRSVLWVGTRTADCMLSRDTNEKQFVNERGMCVNLGVVGVVLCALFIGVYVLLYYVKQYRHSAKRYLSRSKKKKPKIPSSQSTPLINDIELSGMNMRYLSTSFIIERDLSHVDSYNSKKGSVRLESASSMSSSHSYNSNNGSMRYSNLRYNNNQGSMNSNNSNSNLRRDSPNDEYHDDGDYDDGDDGIDYFPVIMEEDGAHHQGISKNKLLGSKRIKKTKKKPDIPNSLPRFPSSLWPSSF